MSRLSTMIIYNKSHQYEWWYTMDVYIAFLPLAFGAAVSPTMITAIILMLSESSYPRLRGLLYIFGATIPLILLSVVLYSFSSSLKDFGLFVRHNSSGIDISIGLILAVVAVWMYQAGKKKKIIIQPTSAIPEKRFPILVHSFLLGILMMATNFSTFALFIPAEKDIFLSAGDFTSQMMSVSLLMVITLLGLELPLLFSSIDPKKASRVLLPIGDVSKRYGPTIAMLLCAVFSVYLLYRGFTIH